MFDLTLYLVRPQVDHRKWNNWLNGLHWPMQLTPHFLLGNLWPNRVEKEGRLEQGVKMEDQNSSKENETKGWVTLGHSN